MNIEEIPNNIYQKAWDIILSRKNDYPEDDWFGLSIDWDLNVWIEEDDTGMMVRRANLYKTFMREDGFLDTCLDDALSLAVEEEFAVIDGFDYDDVPDFDPYPDDVMISLIPSLADEYMEIECPFCQGTNIEGDICLTCREHI